jgi:hypothetical protein
VIEKLYMQQSFSGVPSSIINCESSIVLPVELAQEILLIHAVFKSLLAINEDDRNFVGELAPERIIGVHINLLPAELGLAGEFGQRFLDDFAKVATLPRIKNNLVGHGQSLTKDRKKERAAR